ncbi:hypothetical protein JMJ55_09230 [Belnapia sp. T6]|uniref:Uncharacterized protein n=1 Tax=Belnapia mucosa TaxID=2804532 RepID=A0ABS1V1B3_9PROT|nr:hypothetical protein [Belnapia mucosa]MBL6455504.1 hypothetical protein [Belnapia mucosa]
MKRGRTPRGGGKREARRAAQPEAGELTSLRAALAAAEAKIRRMEDEGLDAFARRRIAELEAGQLVARGQAVEAAVAKSRAEGELQALRNAIGKAPGLNGWLLRRAMRRMGGGT